MSGLRLSDLNKETTYLLTYLSSSSKSGSWRLQLTHIQAQHPPPQTHSVGSICSRFVCSCL